MRAHLASLVHEFRRHTAQTAVVSHRGNRSYRTTYGELAQIAGRFAAELDQRSIAPGDRIVLWGEDSAEWIGVFFGCLLRGVIVVPLDAAGTTEFAGRVLKDVAPRLLAGDQNLLATLKTDVPQLYLSGVAAHLPATPLFTVSDAVNEHTAFQIVFTSGTTSEPKGIVHTHRNVLASLQLIETEIAKYRKYERWVHPLRFLHTLPLSHVFGQFMGLWIPPLLAAEVHFVDRFDGRRMTDLIRREGISVLVAVPRILQLLRAHLLGQFSFLAAELERTKGLSIWKRWWRFRQLHRALGWRFWAVISGGAALPSELETFWSQLGFALIQGYGMTETAALVTLNHPFRIGHGTIGKVLPGRKVRISNEGEILVRGDMLSAATWQSGRMQPRQGDWLATGDLATESESGELRFLGRKGDLIVTGAGLNIHPADLEEAMNGQSGVRGCVVVPCPTASGTAPVAVVIFSGSEEELQAAVGDANRTLADYQQIRRILRWPELQFPYTSTGKLLRRKIAQWACDAVSHRQLSTPPSEDVLTDLIGGITGESVSGAGDSLRLSEDLHLDSLGRVQLQSELGQRLGFELEDDEIASVETLGELRKLLGQTPTANLPLQTTDQTIATATQSVETKTSSSQSHPGSPKRRRTAMPGPIYPRWPWSWPAKTLRIAFTELIMRPLIRLLAAPRVVCQAPDLPQGPLLIISNHVTAYDGALILYALPPALRHRIAIAMSGEMLLDLRRGQNQRNALLNLISPIGYWLVTALFNVFPLPRLRGFQRSFEHAGEAMDRGYSVLIFPEGTRSADAKLQTFRAGIGLLTQQSRVPVVPVSLAGMGQMKKTGWFRSGKLEIRIGNPIPVNEHATPAELTAKLEESIRHLNS